MDSPPGSEPIDDDEILYRRVPAKPPFWDPTATPPLSPEAFKPRVDDTSGLSLGRARYVTPEGEAGKGQGPGYHIAVVRAGDLRRLGLTVVPRPLEDDPGHAEITEIRYDTRRTTEEERLRICSELKPEVLGPFPGKSAGKTP